MDQPVAIARAVIARPKLLLADEPTGNVDDNMALRLMHLFAQLNKLGTTIVIATHNEAMVERLAYPCLQLEDGTLHVSAAANKPVSMQEEQFDHEDPFVLTALPNSPRRRSEKLS